MDVHSPAVRSYNMSRIQAKNTAPELLVRKFLFSKGYRFRINVKSLPGTPDLVLAKYKTVISVQGCFWHGHSQCKYFKLPKTRTEWWKNKISQTAQRDFSNSQKLKSQGFETIIIWECELRKDNAAETLNHLIFRLAQLKVNV